MILMIDRKKTIMTINLFLFVAAFVPVFQMCILVIFLVFCDSKPVQNPNIFWQDKTSKVKVSRWVLVTAFCSKNVYKF